MLSAGFERVGKAKNVRSSPRFWVPGAVGSWAPEPTQLSRGQPAVGGWQSPGRTQAQARAWRGSRGSRLPTSGFFPSSVKPQQRLGPAEPGLGKVRIAERLRVSAHVPGFLARTSSARHYLLFLIIWPLSELLVPGRSLFLSHQERKRSSRRASTIGGCGSPGLERNRLGIAPF